MTVSVGTFNFSNLFSRWNFQGAIDQIAQGGSAGAMTVRYEFTDNVNYRLRRFMGRLDSYGSSLFLAPMVRVFKSLADFKNLFTSHKLEAKKQITPKNSPPKFPTSGWRMAIPQLSSLN